MLFLAGQEIRLCCQTDAMDVTKCVPGVSQSQCRRLLCSDAMFLDHLESAESQCRAVGSTDVPVHGHKSVEHGSIIMWPHVRGEHIHAFRAHGHVRTLIQEILPEKPQRRAFVVL